MEQCKERVVALSKKKGIMAPLKEATHTKTITLLSSQEKGRFVTEHLWVHENPNRFLRVGKDMVRYMDSICRYIHTLAEFVMMMEVP